MQVPPMTRSLLIICALVYLLQAMDSQGWITVHFALWPLGNGSNGLPVALGGWPEFQIWQLLTYGFLHGSFQHILFNGLALWMFGSDLERFWGPGPYLRFVLACIVGAGVAQLIVASMSGEPYPTVGISGGVYGILLGFGMMFPNRMIMPLFPPVPMKAKFAVMLFAGIEVYLGVFTRGGGVAHFAHLGGLATGFVIIQYWRGKLPWRPKRVLRY